MVELVKGVHPTVFQGLQPRLFKSSSIDYGIAIARGRAPSSMLQLLPPPPYLPKTTLKNLLDLVQHDSQPPFDSQPASHYGPTDLGEALLAAAEWATTSNPKSVPNIRHILIITQASFHEAPTLRIPKALLNENEVPGMVYGDIYDLAHRLDKNGVLISVATNFNSSAVQRLCSNLTLSSHPLTATLNPFVTGKIVPHPAPPMTEFQVDFMRNNFYAIQGMDLNVLQGNIFVAISQKPQHKVPVGHPQPPGSNPAGASNFFADEEPKVPSTVMAIGQKPSPLPTRLPNVPGPLNPAAALKGQIPVGAIGKPSPPVPLNSAGLTFPPKPMQIPSPLTKQMPLNPQANARQLQPPLPIPSLTPTSSNPTVPKFGGPLAPISTVATLSQPHNPMKLATGPVLSTGRPFANQYPMNPRPPSQSGNPH